MAECPSVTCSPSTPSRVDTLWAVGWQPLWYLGFADVLSVLSAVGGPRSVRDAVVAAAGMVGFNRADGDEGSGIPEFNSDTPVAVVIRLLRRLHGSHEDGNVGSGSGGAALPCALALPPAVWVAFQSAIIPALQRCHPRVHALHTIHGPMAHALPLLLPQLRVLVIREWSWRDRNRPRPIGPTPHWRTVPHTTALDGRDVTAVTGWDGDDEVVDDGGGGGRGGAGTTHLMHVTAPLLHSPLLTLAAHTLTSYCGPLSDTASGMEALASCVNLRWLHVVGTRMCTLRAHQVAWRQVFTRVHHLTLERCDLLPRTHLIQPPHAVLAELAALGRELQSLRLWQSVPPSAGDTLLQALAPADRLTMLEVDPNHYTTDAHWAAFLPDAGPRLTQLALKASNRYITDALYALVAAHCPAMTTLITPCADAITDAGLVHLATGVCATALTHIDVHRCSIHLPSTVEMLAAALPRLRHVDIVGCPGATPSPTVLHALHDRGITIHASATPSPASPSPRPYRTPAVPAHDTIARALGGGAGRRLRKDDTARVSCPYGCGQAIMPLDVGDHAWVCPRWDGHACPLAPACTFTGTAAQRAAHAPTCRKWVVECPVHCGATLHAQHVQEHMWLQHVAAAEKDAMTTHCPMLFDGCTVAYAPGMWCRPAIATPRPAHPTRPTPALAALPPRHNPPSTSACATARDGMEGEVGEGMPPTAGAATTIRAPPHPPSPPGRVPTCMLLPYQAMARHLFEVGCGRMEYVCISCGTVTPRPQTTCGTPECHRAGVVRGRLNDGLWSEGRPPTPDAVNRQPPPPGAAAGAGDGRGCGT